MSSCLNPRNGGAHKKIEGKLGSTLSVAQIVADTGLENSQNLIEPGVLLWALIALATVQTPLDQCFFKALWDSRNIKVGPLSHAVFLSCISLVEYISGKSTHGHGWHSFDGYYCIHTRIMNWLLYKLVRRKQRSRQIYALHVKLSCTW